MRLGKRHMPRLPGVLPHNKGRSFDRPLFMDQELLLKDQDVSRSHHLSRPCNSPRRLASRGSDVAGMEERGVAARCTETKVLDVPMRLIQLIIRTPEIPMVVSSPRVVLSRAGHLNRRYGNQ